MDWLTCYSAPTVSEAHLVQGFLEQRGVPCLLRSDGPSVYPVPAFGVRVLVPDDWLPVARKFLERPQRRAIGARVVPFRPTRRRA
jgi:hypothetical protein